MRPGGGKGKGAAFERHVCHRLSYWLSGGRRTDLLWRSAMSGGRATVQLAQGKVNLSQSGDLSAISEGAYAFCEKNFIECKHYKDLQLGRSILLGRGGLAAFWRITRREAAKYGKAPVMVAKQNLYPAIVVVDPDQDCFVGTAIIADVYALRARLRLFEDVTKVRLSRGPG